MPAAGTPAPTATGTHGRANAGVTHPTSPTAGTTRRGPRAAKIPVPSTEPSPATTASRTPRARRSSDADAEAAEERVMARTLLTGATAGRGLGVFLPNTAKTPHEPTCGKHDHDT